MKPALNSAKRLTKKKKKNRRQARAAGRHPGGSEKGLKETTTLRFAFCKNSFCGGAARINLRAPNYIILSFSLGGRLPLGPPAAVSCFVLFSAARQAHKTLSKINFQEINPTHKKKMQKLWGKSFSRRRKARQVHYMQAVRLRVGGTSPGVAA